MGKGSMKVSMQLGCVPRLGLGLLDRTTWATGQHCMVTGQDYGEGFHKGFYAVRVRA